MMSSSTDTIISTINTKLNQADTRLHGLKYLEENLLFIPNESLIQYTNLWMLKAIQELENINNDINYLNKICKTISLLVIGAKEIPELNKIVSMQYVKQIISTVTKFDLNRQCGGTFYLISVLLHHYPEPCVRFQDSIKNMCLSIIDSDNITLVTCGAKSYAFLSKAVQRTFKPPLFKSNYTAYMYNEYLLCNTLHTIMNELFSELYDIGSSDELKTLDLPTISHNDILEYLNIVERRITNICFFLSTMLKFKIQRTSVCITDISKLLYRCFDLTMQTRSDDSVRTKHLEQMLFKLHISFLSVFDAFIIGFGCDLLPNSLSMLRSILQMFNWTEKVLHKELTLKDTKLLTTVRIKTYQVLSTWLKYCGLALSIEGKADILLPFILKDVIPKKETIVLTSQNTQHMSRKALKKFRTHNQQSQNNLSSETDKIFRANFDLNAELCVEALIALQQIITKGNQFLKSTFYKKVEDEIISCLYNLYTRSDLKNNCYKLNSKCRFELLRTLKSLLVTPYPNKPLPLAISIEIFKMAQNDYCQEIAEEAELVLNILEKIGHPCTPSLFLTLTTNALDTKRDLNSVIGEEFSSSPQKRQKNISLLNINCEQQNVNQTTDIHIEKSIEVVSQLDANDMCTSSSTNTVSQHSNLILSQRQNDVECIEDVSMEIIHSEISTELMDNENNKISKASQESNDKPNSYLTLKEIQISSPSESITTKHISNNQNLDMQSEKDISDNDDVEKILELFHNVPKSN